MNKRNNMFIEVRHHGRPFSIVVTASAQEAGRQECTHGTSATPARGTSCQTAHIPVLSAPSDLADAVFCSRVSWLSCQCGHSHSHLRSCVYQFWIFYFCIFRSRTFGATRTRCSAIAERPRCRVRYSFPQK